MDLFKDVENLNSELGEPNALESSHENLEKTRKIMDVSHKDWELFKVAKAKVKQRMLEKYAQWELIQELKANAYSPDQSNILNCGFLQMGLGINEKIKLYLITVSLDAYFPHVLEQANRCYTKKWIDQSKSYYVLEQRGTLEDRESIGRGPHIHYFITLTQPKAKSQMVREIANTFKLKPNYIDVKQIKQEPIVHEYLLGTKPGKEKQLKQKADIVWRSNNTILTAYGSPPAR